MSLYSFFYVGENPTVDLIIINPMNEILLIQRSAKSNACPGMMAFPGGFIESDAPQGSTWKEDKETPREAALRELHEETNLKLDLNTELILVGEYVGHRRDPRDNDKAWSKTYAFLYRINEQIYSEQKDFIRGQDDADLAKWIPLKEACRMKLAFDHGKILEDALTKFL